ncbi:hypothetical protein APR11_002902 [Nocardia amikacinitolerans]|uniref:hypothetical protein n=1 Tax=Nocardia amikacinitolerans TaxID=756689 RepID=UPI0020A58DD3|nr:hypothetical protein [Nocardia amikacinitolerans]MCP2296474.1 hypothetical protein [Nocardia amikacinitolerans]
MSQHHRLRTATVALAGAALLTVGAAALETPEATAAPGGPAVTKVDHPFDFGGEEQTDEDKDDEKDEPAEHAEKAEQNGGDVATKVIDMLTGNAGEAIEFLGGVVKCTLNVATDAVKCDM